MDFSHATKLQIMRTLGKLHLLGCASNHPIVSQLKSELARRERVLKSKTANDDGMRWLFKIAPDAWVTADDADLLAAIGLAAVAVGSAEAEKAFKYCQEKGLIRLNPAYHPKGK